jgi:DNA-binding NarL/FixJ family response regulator
MTANPGRQIKILIVDDHASVRAGIRNLLQAAEDMIVIEEGANGMEALDLAKKRRPDIILLDIELPDLRGDAVMRRIRNAQPEIKVLAVTSYGDAEYVRSMLENGAAGYITKDEAPAKLVEAIRSIIYRGKSWFSPELLKKSDLSPPKVQDLTLQETRILRQLLLNKSELEIGEALDLEERRVVNYLHLLMKKFNVESLPALRLIAEDLLGPAQH